MATVITISGGEYAGQWSAWGFKYVLDSTQDNSGNSRWFELWADTPQDGSAAGYSWGKDKGFEIRRSGSSGNYAYTCYVNTGSNAEENNDEPDKVNTSNNSSTAQASMAVTTNQLYLFQGTTLKGITVNYDFTSLFSSGSGSGSGSSSSSSVFRKGSSNFW